MLKAVQTSFDTSTAVSLGMSPALSFPVTGLSTPQDLIVMTGTIAVIWMGVFGAAEGTLAEEITNSIKGGVEKVGKGLATLPIKYMPTGLTNPDTGEDIKLGEFAPLLQQTADKISQPMRGLADSVYQKAPPATDAEISKLDKKNAPEILKKIVANNPENMSKTRKEALYKKLKAMKPDERRKIDGLPEFYKELKAVKDKDPKDSQSLKGASTKLAATLGANTGGINTKALGGGKRPATEPGQRDTPTPAVAPGDLKGPVNGYVPTGSDSTYTTKGQKGADAKAVPSITAKRAEKNNQSLRGITSTSMATDGKLDGTKVAEHVVKYLSIDGNVPTAANIRKRLTDEDWDRLVGEGGNQPFKTAPDFQAAIDKANK